LFFVYSSKCKRTTQTRETRTSGEAAAGSSQQKSKQVNNDATIPRKRNSAAVSMTGQKDFTRPEEMWAESDLRKEFEQFRPRLEESQQGPVTTTTSSTAGQHITGKVRKEPESDHSLRSSAQRRALQRNRPMKIEHRTSSYCQTKQP